MESFFVAGIRAGAFLAYIILSNHQLVKVIPNLAAELNKYGINDYSKLAPADIFNWPAMFT